MRNKQRQAKEFLIELCMAHSQAVHARNEHKRKSDGSQILLKMYDEKIFQLESQITSSVKSWLGCEQPPHGEQSRKDV